jgi:DNA helicase-2/ATP-dependent DNA helicase PcrA
LVDEYQDTNHSQYLIVRALSDKFQNICVVVMMRKVFMLFECEYQQHFEFSEDYDGVKTFRLEQNYRSTKIL